MRLYEAVASGAFAIGLWRLWAAVEQWLLWYRWQVADPSAADLYLTNTYVELFGFLLAVAGGIAVLRLGRSPAVAVTGAGPAHRTRLPVGRLAVVLIMAVLLASLLTYGGRWLAVDRCLDAGGRWDPAERVCVAGNPAPRAAP